MQGDDAHCPLTCAQVTRRRRLPLNWPVSPKPAETRRPVATITSVQIPHYKDLPTEVHLNAHDAKELFRRRRCVRGGSCVGTQRFHRSRRRGGNVSFPEHLKKNNCHSRRGRERVQRVSPLEPDWDRFVCRNQNPRPSPFHLKVSLIIAASQVQRTGVIIILMHLLCACRIVCSVFVSCKI